MLNLRPNFWKIFLGHFIPIYTNYYYLTWWKKSEKNYDFPFVQVKKSWKNLIFDPFLAYLAQKMAISAPPENDEKRKNHLFTQTYDFISFSQI